MWGCLWPSRVLLLRDPRGLLGRRMLSMVLGCVYSLTVECDLRDAQVYYRFVSIGVSIWIPMHSGQGYLSGVFYLFVLSLYGGTGFLRLCGLCVFGSVFWAPLAGRG